MSEEKKMLAGQDYDSRDSELLKKYHRAKKILNTYNHLDSENSAEKDRLLTDLLHYKGSKVWIEPPFYCEYGEFISIGESSYIGPNCVFVDTNGITIGDNGLIGPCVQIYASRHPLKASERILYEGGQSRYVTSTSPVSIGENAWIGGGVIILPGVTIGDNVVIGAGSVVTKDIPDNVLAMGNPCKVIRTIDDYNRPVLV